MDERLLAKVRASLQHSNKSPASLVLLEDVDASAADDVELVAGVALADDGRARWEIFALKQIGNLVETTNGKSLSTDTDDRNLIFSSRSRRPQLIIIFWKTFRSSEKTLQLVSAGRRRRRKRNKLIN